MTDRNQTNCPICKKTANQNMAGLSDYWFCPDCQLGWAKRFPPIKYKDNYYTSGSSTLSRLFAPVGLLFLQIRKLYVKPGLKDLWIDVGAGEGNFLTTVNSTQKVGIEISKSGRALMRDKGIAVLTEREFLKKSGLNAQVVSFWHVLEHLSDPEKYLVAARKNLSSTGQVVIGVPNVDSWELRLFNKYWFHLAPQHHLWFFSPKSLKMIIEKTGFKVEKIDYWAIEHHLAGTLQSFINATSQSDNVLHKLVRRSEGLSSLSSKQTFWIVFWCTLGLPVIILFWAVSALMKKPGAFVLVVSKY